RMAGDHQVLVGFYHIGADPALPCTDTGPMLLVGPLVEFDPEPAARSADGAAHRRGILADPGGEDDALETAQRHRERGDFAVPAVAKDLDGKARAWLLARQKLPEIR